MVNVLDDCQLVIKKEKAEESKRSEATGQLYNVLLNYIQQQKLLASVERNILQANSLSSKIKPEQIFAQVKLKSENRPQNVVRFYEKALKAHRSIMNMEKDIADPLRHTEYDFYDKLYSALMVYFIALDYANEKKFMESYTVLAKVQQEVEDALEFFQRNNLKGAKLLKEQDRLNEIAKQIRFLSCKIASKNVLQRQETLSSLESKMGEMHVKAQEQQSALRIDNLYDILFDFAGNPKTQHQQDKLVFKGNNFDFLESEGKNIDTQALAKKAVDVKQLRLTKQFTLVNPVPKF